MSLPAPDALVALDQALRCEASATVALERWCRERGMSGRMHVERLDRPGTAPPPVPGDRLKTLRPRYRHIRMFCGATAVSEAENWYDASALDAEMTRALDETDTPFGIVVAPLHFRRSILSTRLDEASLENVAALYAQHRGDPFCIVVERYRSPRRC